MSEERKRPLKQFEVILAVGPYRVGDKIQPTGLYRDVLLKRGYIREITDEMAAAARAAQPEANRMVELPRKDESDLRLATRAKRGR